MREAASIGALFILRPVGADSLALDLKWSDRREPGLVIISGHYGTLVSGSAEGWAVLHRQSWDISGPGGHMMEVGCDGQPHRTFPEWLMVQSEHTRMRGLQVHSTSGIAAAPDGFFAGMPKIVPQPKPSVTKVEIFHFPNGQIRGSFLLHGRWYIQDYHSGRGLLLTTRSPLPVFIVLPAELVAEQSRL